ncbi:cellulose synthase complex outer membrane protein BcsC [Oceanimonas sp. GK1]|uniref:cellulose synthase complex outer membrane protein BcsC n=1 Tax=Oceanimonas sp. (strain GK1 / IBRC-M 10197) TaxID=511062 RepID=UPI0005A0F055|nr:cellulose synthase complex outer membrane protein BcsC [Oceanimonas sp. GK1]
MQLAVLSACCLWALSHSVMAEPGTPAGQRAFLLEQLRLGQALYRDDMVENALGRLELMAPLDADVALAAMEFSLRKGEFEQARARLARLRTAGVSEITLQQGQALLAAYNDDGEALRQQAQLLAASGQPQKAMALYRQLWGEQPPGLQFGLEHWRTQAQVDGERPRAISRLEQLEQRFPGNPELRLTLARLWLADEQPERALALLGQLAESPAVANRAAELEYNYLIDLPVSERSAGLWQRFLERYPGSSYEHGGRRVWQQQRALLNDPAWRAGQRGVVLAEQERYHQALPLLRRAVTAYPQHAGFQGALGQTLIQLEQYPQAEAALSRAVEREQDGGLISKWQDLQQYAQALVWVQKGDRALSNEQYRLAEQAFLQARQLRPADVPPLLGLVQVALAQENRIVAERWLQRARQMVPLDARVIYALVDFYRVESSERAVAVLRALPVGVRRDYAALEDRLQLEQLTPQIEQAQAEGRTNDAISLLRQAVQLAPPQPWLTYDLANLLQQQGQSQDAAVVFAPLLQRHGDDPEVRHAHAQFLAAQNKDAAALTSLQQIEPERWSEGMSALASRLAGELRRARAVQLREQGYEAGAQELLAQAGTVDDRLLLADWLTEDERYPQALRAYQRIYAEAPDNTDAWLGVAESRLALQQLAQARAWLQSHSLPADASMNQRRRYINVLAATGEQQQAAAQMTALVAEAPADPLLLRDAARLQDNSEHALSLYAQGLAALGELDFEAVAPLDGAALTRATREQSGDDWLQRSLKREGADRYRRQNLTLQLQQDFGWRTDNNPTGVNDLRLNTSLLRAEWPWVNGRAWLQAEQVGLNAGTPEADDRFGGCNAVIGGCDVGSQNSSGTGLAVGWQGDQWSWDLGHSPLGFEVNNWLGGLNYDGDWGELGYNLTLSRRPMSNSLVSYAGAVDPVTGQRWGGVTATGLTLGLSYDQGEESGIWGSLGAHSLNGENVADNQRFSAMTGYYYRLIEQPHEQLRVGTSLLYFQYQKDLSEDTLGQGGYYSPQRYVSLGLPVRYARRGEHWSGVLEGSPGWSWSRSEGGDLYPAQWSAIAASGKPTRPNAARTSEADTGGGPGISLAARGEYRLDEHWILGGGLNWQLSDEYAPGHGFLYLRYHFSPWLGDLDMPVEPLTPYSEWR